MDSLSGPFPAGTSSQRKVKRSLKKSASTLSLDRIHKKNQLSIKTAFSSQSVNNEEKSLNPATFRSQSSSPSARRSFAPKVLPEPILMPAFDAGSSIPLQSQTRIKALPEEEREILRSASTSSASSLSFNVYPQQPSSNLSSSETFSSGTRSLGIDSRSFGAPESSTWSDDEDEEEVREELSSGSGLLPFKTKSRLPIENSLLVEASPGIEADNLPGAKAREVLGLNSEGWELGPGAESLGRSSINDNRRHSLLPGVLSFGGRRNSMNGTETGSPSFKPSLNFKRNSQVASPESPFLSTTPSPRSSNASPISATKETLGFIIKNQKKGSKVEKVKPEAFNVTAADELDWEEELESAARTAQVHSSHLHRLPNNALRHREAQDSAINYVPMTRRGSADTALKASQSGLKRQISFNSISDYITSFDRTEPNSKRTGRDLKVYITPLNLPSPEAVRAASKARGACQGRPRQDPHPLPSWASSSRSSSISSLDRMKPVADHNKLPRSESAASRRPVDVPSRPPSSEIKARPAPPRPARSHLRSTSDSRGTSSVSQFVERKQARPSTSTNHAAAAVKEIETISRPIPPLHDQSPVSSNSPEFEILGPQLAESINLSPEPGLSNSSSSPSSDSSQPEFPRLTSPALGVNGSQEGLNDLGAEESKDEAISNIIEISSLSYPGLDTISPPSSAAFLSIPKTAPGPPAPSIPSPELETNKRTNASNGSGSTTSASPMRASISSLKALKKVSNFFSNSSPSNLISSKPTEAPASLNSSDNTLNDPSLESSEGGSNREKDEGGLIMLQLADPEQGHFSSQSQARASPYPETARSSFVFTSSSENQGKIGEEADDFTKALSSLSFFNENSFDQQRMSRSKSANPILPSITFQCSSYQRESSSTDRTSFRNSMFSQSWKPSTSYNDSTRLSSSFNSDNSLSTRFSRGERSHLPDVPRPISQVSQNSMDFDFDFEPEFLRGSKLTPIPGTPGSGRESEFMTAGPFSPISGFTLDGAADGEATSRDSKIYRRFTNQLSPPSTEAEDGQDLLDFFKVQGFD